MKRIALASTLTLSIAVPAVANADRSSLITRYERAYAHVVHVYGKRAAGCKLFATCHVKATKRRLIKSTNVLHRFFAPSPPPPTPSPAPAATSTVTSSAPTVSSTGGGASGVPACASESGTNYSTGPDNTNPSGASGRYQIMPFHWSTDCAGLSPTPSGQDQCAAIIYRNSGAGAWVGCGG